MFWVRSCSSCTPRNFSQHNGKQACRCADDSTLVAFEPSPCERVAVTESLNHDLNWVSMWCDLWGMELNASKTKTIIVSRSCTIHPQSTPLTLNGIVLKEFADLVILGVTFAARIDI